jgi:hypothetical protein
LQLLLSKNNKIAYNSTTSGGREKNKRIFEILAILEKNSTYFTHLNNDQILSREVSHRYLVTAKLFAGQNTLICCHSIQGVKASTGEASYMARLFR